VLCPVLTSVSIDTDCSSSAARAVTSFSLTTTLPSAQAAVRSIPGGVVVRACVRACVCVCVREKCVVLAHNQALLRVRAIVTQHTKLFGTGSKHLSQTTTAATERVCGCLTRANEVPNRLKCGIACGELSLDRALQVNVDACRHACAAARPTHCQTLSPFGTGTWNLELGIERLRYRRAGAHIQTKHSNNCLRVDS
jgi:hypothetical protein